MPKEETLARMTEMLRMSFAHLGKMGPPGSEGKCGPECYGVKLPLADCPEWIKACNVSLTTTQGSAS